MNLVGSMPTTNLASTFGREKKWTCEFHFTCEKQSHPQCK